MMLDNNPFRRLFEVTSIPRLVTRVAAACVAADSYRALDTFVSALDQHHYSCGPMHHAMLLARVDECGLTFKRMQTYAYEFLAWRSRHI